MQSLPAVLNATSTEQHRGPSSAQRQFNKDSAIQHSVLTLVLTDAAR